MKKIKYIALLVFAILIGAFFLLKNKIFSINKKQEIPVIENYVYLKIKYDITLSDKKLLPSKMKNFKNTLESESFLIENNLNYLGNLFDIEVNSNLSKNNIIYFYPNDDVEVIKTSRFNVTTEFFTSRNITENVAKKTVKILNDLNNTYDNCLKLLKEIYKGTANVAFYNKAIPKLIY